MKIETKLCKHGTFAFFADDEYVGKSLLSYGEYSEDEVNIFKNVLRPDDIAIEIGSNIGAHTLPMARLCKEVWAFEPQPENYELLLKNIENNGIENVNALNIAVGDRVGTINIPLLGELEHKNFGRVEAGKGSEPVRLVTIDSCFGSGFDKVKLIKIDCEGMELECLKGAKELILRDRPILYLENDRDDKSAELIAYLIEDLDYRSYWHNPPLFFQDNFAHNPKNVWKANVVSQNMLCVPLAAGYKIERMTEVGDQRIDAEMHKREYRRMQKILAVHPDDLNARFEAAHYANLSGDYSEARSLLRQNLEVDPSHIPSKALSGMLDLWDGNYKDGWQGYEYRYDLHSSISHKFNFWKDHRQKHWDGQPTDEVVLIHSEQGFGDSIMFVRFMDVVLELAPNAILQVQPQLFELFEYSNIVPKGKLFRQNRTLPKWTSHCSLPSLPATLKLSEESQLVRKPYLFADPELIATYKRRNIPSMSICLKGGAGSERSYSRDLPMALFEPLADKYGLFAPIDNTDNKFESFAESAAAICATNLLLTVDTSVAHLGGALGIPTWLLLSFDPDFRWRRDRSDTPWYPSMKIFRQKKFMDWSNVIDEVNYHLDRCQAAQAAE